MLQQDTNEAPIETPSDRSPEKLTPQALYRIYPCKIAVL